MELSERIFYALGDLVVKSKIKKSENVLLLNVVLVVSFPDLVS